MACLATPQILSLSLHVPIVQRCPSYAMHAYVRCMRAWCVRVCACVPASPFFSPLFFFPFLFPCPFPSPSARSTTGGYFFSNRWWPTEAPLFLFHPSSLAFHPFHCFSSSLSLSLLFLSPFFPSFFLFFLQVHPLSPFRFRIGVLFIHRRPEWPLAPRFFT